MSRVRGDDELLELLNIMGGKRANHGREQEDELAEKTRGDITMNGKGGDDDERNASVTASTKASTAACVPETGWNGSIWNPHVVVSDGDRLGAQKLAGGGGAPLKLVSPYEEVLRQQAMAVVFSKFQVLCKELGVRGKNETFERWQFSRKLKEGPGGDPILPAASFFCPGLAAELQELGVSKPQARNLCCELGRASKSTLKTLTKQLRAQAVPVGTSSSSSKNGVIVQRIDATTFVLQLGKNRLRLNSAHYDKMKELFRRARAEGVGSFVRSSSTSASSDATSEWTGAFHDCLFACLMRYEALQGGGFQASMGGNAFDVLLRHFDARMECFASPFNCRYSKYCSAFQDTDVPFGSLGSFFHFRPTEGTFEANPPFVRDVILKMADHMNHLLKATTKALSFIVIIPAWEDAPGWRRLRDSRFLSKHVKLDQKDHSYCEGKQHLRRNRFRLASFHTSIFFLQTPEAARSAPVTEQACNELRQSFTPRSETNMSQDFDSVGTSSISGAKQRAGDSEGEPLELGLGLGLWTGSREGVVAANGAGQHRAGATTSGDSKGRNNGKMLQPLDIYSAKGKDMDGENKHSGTERAMTKVNSGGAGRESIGSADQNLVGRRRGGQDIKSMRKERPKSNNVDGVPKEADRRRRLEMEQGDRDGGAREPIASTLSVASRGNEPSNPTNSPVFQYIGHDNGGVKSTIGRERRKRKGEKTTKGTDWEGAAGKSKRRRLSPVAEEAVPTPTKNRRKKRTASKHGEEEERR